MRTFILGAIVASASAMSSSHLRGAPEEKKVEKEDKKEEKDEEKKAEKNTTMLNPTETDERGPRGHFYYAKTCSDCFYKGEQCGCDPAMEYFACVTKHCHAADSTLFAEKCTTLGNKCYKDMNINCRGSDTFCESKLNKLPEGGLGFDLDIDSDDAYCGPHGKCIGKIGLKVHIKNAPKKEKKEKAPKVTAQAPAPKSIFARGSPAPGPMAAASPASEKPTEDDEEEEEEIWLECGLPKKDHASIDAKEDWILCQKKVKGDKEKCKIPMFSELNAGDHKEAYCVLTEGKDGKRLTQPHWSKVINVHEKPKPCATTAVVAKEEVQKTEEQKDEKPKSAPKKEEKAKKEEAPVVVENTNKLPWMVEKEKRAAAKKLADAKEAKEEDKEEKVEKKTADKAATGVKNDSGLPWMKGKEAPAPHKVAMEGETPLATGNTQKLPWMVEKEKRAAKASDAKDAEKAKEEDKMAKVEKKEADEPAKDPNAKHPSGLPWMHGK